MDTSPLNDEDRAKLKAKLDERQADLSVAILANAELRLPLFAHEVSDIGNKGERRIREVVPYMEDERDIQELLQIADALERMENGVYGLCSDCSCVIPTSQLEALPASERCVICEARFESARP